MTKETLEKANILFSEIEELEGLLFHIQESKNMIFEKENLNRYTISLKEPVSEVERIININSAHLIYTIKNRIAQLKRDFKKL
jgi:hypothetical protein